ncbi:unnamed protein product, partial [Phaeothamnion confervicola]
VWQRCRWAPRWYRAERGRKSLQLFYHKCKSKIRLLSQPLTVKEVQTGLAVDAELPSTAEKASFRTSLSKLLRACMSQGLLTPLRSAAAPVSASNAGGAAAAAAASASNAGN